MGRIWSEIPIVYVEEIRRATGRTLYRVMTLVVPVILLVVMISIPVVRDLTSSGESGEAKAGRMGLIDFSGQLSGEAVAEGSIRTFPDRETAVAALVANEIDSLFVIPGDYLANGRVEWLHRGSVVSTGLSAKDDQSRIQSLLREVLVRNVLRPDLKTRFLCPASFESIVVGEGGSTKEGARPFSVISVSYIFSVLLLMSIAAGSGYLLQSVSDEKENRMVEILLTSVSPLGMMTGKVLALGSVGLLQVMVWALSIALIGPRILEGFPQLGQLAMDPMFLLSLVAFFLAGYFVLGVTVAGIGAATTSYHEGSQISVIVYMTAAAPLFFIMLIAGNPDGELARILSFIPFTAPTTMVVRMGAAHIPLLEIVASLAVTFLGGVLLLWGSARVFRAGLLMYGQRMSLRRVLTALRQAG